MEIENQDAANPENGDENKRLPGVPYPVETVLGSVATIGGIVSTFGSTAVISKEDISKATGKKVATLTLHYSTFQQYGILEKVHGKGFKTTALFKKYADKIYPQHEREALLEMFGNAPLYAKIISNVNNEYLPTEDKFVTVLKGEPYNINPSSAERAAKIFFDNIRGLNLVVNNKFQYSLSPNGAAQIRQEQEKTLPPPPPAAEDSDNMITILIPFKKKGDKATLTFPEVYEDSDMDKISRIVQAYRTAVNEKKE